jgi:uncharacterized protein YaaR (DUF327 family)
MLELLSQHITKINKIINSCTTLEHVESAKQVIRNFVDYWKVKKVSTKTIRHYLYHFNTLIYFKLKLINYNE